MTISEETPPQAPASRDAANWAKPVDRLSAGSLAGASVDTVTGRRVAGPLQGVGQLWQKTFKGRPDGVDMPPQALFGSWKDQFPSFWHNWPKPCSGPATRRP